MPNGEQLKALLQSHADGDEARFLSIAMQMAAHEAKLGHGKLAQELRDLIDKVKTIRRAGDNQPIPLVKPRGELSDILSATYPKLRLADMVLAPDIAASLHRLIKEHSYVQKIRSHGLAPRKKLLLIGPPGTGKTLTASVIAGELGLPLFVVRLDSLMTKYMGETAAKLRLIFNSINDVRGVYLFDEFDSIGAHRGLTNDVGEIRRVLNSFLQLIEQDDSNSLLIAATNHPTLLDHALFRRFDDVIEYRLPGETEIVSVLKSKLAGFTVSKPQRL
ncbi:MAG: ATP-binding protein [Gammaproteobacteria bacterium]|nr:ATP-binding protein [Gammaproteobacteria bacterium]